MRFTLFLMFWLIISQANSQTYSISKIQPTLLKNADAIVRFDKMKILVKAYDAMEVTSERAVTVLNDKGQTHLNSFAFYDNNSKIKNLNALIYDFNGKEVEEFKERDFSDQSATGQGTLYSDSRIKFLNYTPIRYPYTVVLKKTYTTSDTAFMPNWYFLDGYRVSTETSEFIVELPKDVPFRFEENNLENFGILIQNSDNKLHYSASNLEAIESEDFDPELREYAPNVKVTLEKFQLKGVDGQAKTWKEFGKWIYQSLLEGKNELDPSTIQKMKSLVQNIDDPKQKVRAIYKYVQDNTRYISVQMGIGGWMPISAKEVDRVKYGDCKGLTNYTMALLKAVGIDSYYTVVNADERMRSLDIDFPSLQGNHAFLNVPLKGKELWLECTSQVVPADFLGTFTDNRYVLKITPDGGEMVRSRRYEPEQSKQRTSAEIMIKENSISAEVEISSTGIQYNQKYNLSNDSAEDIEKHYKNYWDYINGLNITSNTVLNDKDQIVVQENISINTSGYLSLAGERMLFAPNMLNRNLFVPKKNTNRKREVVIKRGYLDEDEYIIEFPENYLLESTLDPMEIINEFGEYIVSLEKISEHKLRYKRRLLIKAGIFPNAVYNDYRDFRKTIAKADGSKIVLINTTK